MPDRRFSEEDAQRIFALASERQKRAASLELETLSLDELEDVGQDAGIDPRFVREAVADLMRPDRIPVRRSFLGIPMELRRTRRFPGSINDASWSRIVSRLQGLFDQVGVVTEASGMRQWSNSSLEHGAVRVHVETEPSGTRVTIERKRSNMIPLAMIVIINSLVLMSIALIQNAVSGGAADVIIALAVLLTVSVGAAGAVWLGSRRSTRREIERFGEALGYFEDVIGASRDEAEAAVMGVAKDRLQIPDEDVYGEEMREPDRLVRTRPTRDR